MDPFDCVWPIRKVLKARRFGPDSDVKAEVVQWFQ
jgi:hypothetical protein